MIWGMICSDGPIAMVEITGRLNADDYVAILESNVLGKRVF